MRVGKNLTQALLILLLDFSLSAVALVLASKKRSTRQWKARNYGKTGTASNCRTNV